uniref:Mannosylglycerate synthase GT domain-containing protein n=1 Tax=Chromera velia CCMP2878 TaxID=1169474 RepID=A0A0G4F8E1_9ALVE|eukprot:Cvel_15698.t1-p1 / transcript=Cvel_15698.t1 / gene=Cvel_15698 / organism=Chromera_velia_CCMP2878 / gene_product=hypothetical protein / transcript_product=hypothetical protein / location=Cvel_scaffold1172:3749-5911(-) / protein_length=523 / sequence_SO=supercontig / SO=protein_coding / is_pseudo=false
MSTPSDKYDVVIGLPSYNEVDSIAKVTKAADEGCSRFFAGKRCLLINADCLSDDETRAIFQQTPTKADKKVLTTAIPAEGKGAALRLIFHEVLSSDAQWCITLDTDLETLCAGWLGTFAHALMEGADFVAPRYRRHRLDGTITNLVCFPVVCAAYGVHLRQPIGGDFGFSAAAVHAFFDNADAWPKAASKYGIDILMSSSCLAAGLKIAEAELPPKVHKPSLPKLKPMSEQVISTLLAQLVRAAFTERLSLPSKEKEEANLSDLRPSVPLTLWQGAESLSDVPEISVDPSCLSEAARELWETRKEVFFRVLPPHLYSALELSVAVEGGVWTDKRGWAEILGWAVGEAVFLGNEKREGRDRDPKSSDEEKMKDVTAVVQVAFLSRAADHIREVAGKTNEDAETCVWGGADTLRQVVSEQGRKENLASPDRKKESECAPPLLSTEEEGKKPSSSLTPLVLEVSQGLDEGHGEGQKVCRDSRKSSAETVDTPTERGGADKEKERDTGTKVEKGTRKTGETFPMRIQ